MMNDILSDKFKSDIREDLKFGYSLLDIGY